MFPHVLRRELGIKDDTLIGEMKLWFEHNVGWESHMTGWHLVMCEPRVCLHVVEAEMGVKFTC